MTWTDLAIFAAGFLSYPVFFYVLILVFGNEHEKEGM